MAKQEEMLDLTKFEMASGEAWKSFKAACRELEAALEGKKSITDKTKLAAITVGGYAKLKGAEVHRMAVEIMVRRRALPETLDLPRLPEPK